MKIPIEISARHIHLTQESLGKLFGANNRLHVLRYLSQPHQFAARETVEIASSTAIFDKVRIIGPCRSENQLEISRTDSYKVGINPPVAISGDLEDSVGGIEIVGPKGKIKLRRGVIIAQRHLHISPYEAKEFKLKHGQLVSIKTRGQRSVTFHHIYVRSREGIDELSFQLDTDEANAAGVKQGDVGEIIR